MASIVKLAPGGMLNLRLDSGNDSASRAAAEILGAALPGPNSWIAAPNTEVLWQAYDEWLVVTPDGRQQALAASLRSALGDMHHAITDVSDLRITIAIEGPHARDVLQKGCAVDLHPRVFSAGSCITTALARARVMLRQLSDAPAYELLVERSYGDYLWEWLVDAAMEHSRADIM